MKQVALALKQIVLNADADLSDRIHAASVLLEIVRETGVSLDE